MSTTRVTIAYQVIRIVLIILLALIFLVSLVYFIKAIDAIGDDVEGARETHWGHEVEEAPVVPRRNVKHPDEFDEESSREIEKEGDEVVTVHRRANNHRGRLITGHHHFTVTKSQHKQHHILSLIIWVVLTLFCAILSLAGIIGAFFGNACLVVFSACMILVHAIFSHILPWFHIQLPAMTSNWFVIALEAPTILLAIVFVGLYRAKQKATMSKNRKRRILY